MREALMFSPPAAIKSGTSGRAFSSLRSMPRAGRCAALGVTGRRVAFLAFMAAVWLLALALSFTTT